MRRAFFTVVLCLVAGCSGTDDPKAVSTTAEVSDPLVKTASPTVDESDPEVIYSRLVEEDKVRPPFTPSEALRKVREDPQINKLPEDELETLALQMCERVSVLHGNPGDVGRTLAEIMSMARDKGLSAGFAALGPAWQCPQHWAVMSALPPGS